MGIAKIIAAAALALTGVAGTTAPVSAAPVTVVSAAALAQDYGYRDGHRYRDDRRRWDRRSRGWDRGRGYDRGRYHRGRSHRVCWNEWRRGHRVTVCRRR